MKELYKLSDDLVPHVETTYLTEELANIHNELREKYIKIIKAVVAWAEANDITEVRYYYSDGYGCQFEAGYGFMRICFQNISMPFMEIGKTYKLSLGGK